MKSMKDFRGTVISLGDRVVYPGYHQGDLMMYEGVVSDVDSVMKVCIVPPPESQGSHYVDMVFPNLVTVLGVTNDD